MFEAQFAETVQLRWRWFRSNEGCRPRLARRRPNSREQLAMVIMYTHQLESQETVPARW